MTAPAQLVQKLWNYCHILRDDGFSYDDYAGSVPSALASPFCEKHSSEPSDE
jgi:type I restriction enzyme M protein